MLPGHLTEDLQLFSLNDFTAVRNGELAPRMKELLKLGTVHVGSCVVRNQRLSPHIVAVQQKVLKKNVIYKQALP